MEMDSECFIIPGYTNISFKSDVAKICAAHNEHFEWISKNLSFDEVKGSYALNSQFIALLLRIADYLDIDEERAPLYLYNYLSPKDYGDLEWKQHFVIENKEKIAIDQKYDNGRGMSIDILKNYFLNVGVSYYVSDDYQFKGYKYLPIGNYGIGFLACFMLSDKVNVITKYYGESRANKVQVSQSAGL